MGQRGWYPLSKVLLELQNDYTPAHPELIVTEESITGAFPDIPDQQAGWLMNTLLENACHKGMRAISSDEMACLHTQRAVKGLSMSLNAMAKRTDVRLRQLEKMLTNVQQSIDVDKRKHEDLHEGEESQKRSWERASASSEEPQVAEEPAAQQVSPSSWVIKEQSFLRPVEDVENHSKDSE